MRNASYNKGLKQILRLYTRYLSIINRRPKLSRDSTVHLRGAIKADTRAVTLSSDTIAKQPSAHPELMLAKYRLLPKSPRAGLVIQQSDRVVIFFHEDKRIYRTVVKSTRDGKEVCVTSFHRVGKGNIKQVRNCGAVIKEEW